MTDINTLTSVIMEKKNGASTLVFSDNHVISNHYTENDMMLSQSFLNIEEITFQQLIEIHDYFSKQLTKKAKKILETIK
jgi:hypothetical protein